MKKRSQMEIMGIAIVVIILTIIIMFVIRWGALKKPVEYKKEFAQSEIATNLVNTMLSTTTDCKGMTFNDLFQDCDTTKTECSAGKNTCKYAEEEVPKIFTGTLGVWKYKYEFSVIRNSDPPIDVIIPIDECKDAKGNIIKERKTASYPLPGNLEAKLAICG